MTQPFNKTTHSKIRELRRNSDKNEPATSPEVKNVSREYGGMKLIPWRDIWASLTMAKIRGNGEMVEVFYDTLFKDAIFDDRGAWSIDLRKKN